MFGPKQNDTLRFIDIKNPAPGGGSEDTELFYVDRHGDFFGRDLRCRSLSSTEGVDGVFPTMRVKTLLAGHDSLWLGSRLHISVSGDRARLMYRNATVPVYLQNLGVTENDLPSGVDAASASLQNWIDLSISHSGGDDLSTIFPASETADFKQASVFNEVHIKPHADTGPAGLTIEQTQSTGQPVITFIGSDPGTGAGMIEFKKNVGGTVSTNSTILSVEPSGGNAAHLYLTQVNGDLTMTSTSSGGLGGNINLTCDSVNLPASSALTLGTRSCFAELTTNQTNIATNTAAIAGLGGSSNLSANLLTLDGTTGAGSDNLIRLLTSRNVAGSQTNELLFELENTASNNNNSHSWHFTQYEGNSFFISHTDYTGVRKDQIQLVDDHIGFGQMAGSAAHGNQDTDFAGICVKGHGQALSNFTFAPNDTGISSLPAEYVKIGTGRTGGTKFIYEGTPNPPNSATDWGDVGEWRWTSDYIYVCTSTNVWKRAALGTWPVAADSYMYIPASASNPYYLLLNKTLVVGSTNTAANETYVVFLPNSSTIPDGHRIEIICGAASTNTTSTLWLKTASDAFHLTSAHRYNNNQCNIPINGGRFVAFWVSASGGGWFLQSHSAFFPCALFPSPCCSEYLGFAASWPVFPQPFSRAP